MIVIKTEHLCKHYGKIQAINDLSISIEQGEIFTFLGANGAGKSTTVNLLTTLQKPTSGNATILGKDLIRDYKDIRRAITLMSQGAAIDAFLSVYDNLKFYARLEQIDMKKWHKLADEILSEFDLAEKKYANVMTLSGGQVRRLQLARCFLSDRPVVIFDEPTLGVDVVGKFKIWDMIKKYTRENKWTVILCTNDMAEAESLADRIGFLQQGKLIKIGTPDQLKNQAAGRQIKVTFEQSIDESLMQKLGYPISHKNGCVTIHVDDVNFDLRPLLSKLGEFGAITGVNVEKPSLIDVFRAVKGE